MFNYPHITTKSTNKLIDNNIGNSLHYMLTMNRPQVAQMEDDLDRMIESLGDLVETDSRAQALANTLDYRKTALNEVETAMQCFTDYYKKEYNETFTPRETSSPTVRKSDGKSLIAAKLAARKDVPAPEASAF